MKAEIDCGHAVRNLVVTVQVKNLWRLKLGLLLIALAARVLRCSVAVNGVDVAESR